VKSDFFSEGKKTRGEFGVKVKRTRKKKRRKGKEEKKGGFGRGGWGKVIE